MMSKAHRARLIAGFALLFLAASFCQAEQSRKPIATTPHFAFYSDFEPNLNDALVNAGVARKFSKPQLFHDGDEAACFGKLPQSTRAAWERAVDYYAEIISPAGANSRQQYLLRAQLAGFGDDLKDAAAREFVEIAQGFRAAAAPAYRACRWKAQDEKNRRWLEAVKPLLAANEQKLAARVEPLYQTKWTSLPIPVDIVQTVDFTGANTILSGPGSGHILIANENEVAYALETLFHEASHLLMGHDAPLRAALEKAANAANFKLPGELWHVVLFYTTGEAVRRVLEEEDKTGYKPMLYGIFERGVWKQYRQPLESEWKTYVDGKENLNQASAGLIAAVQKQAAHSK